MPRKVETRDISLDGAFIAIQKFKGCVIPREIRERALTIKPDIVKLKQIALFKTMKLTYQMISHHVKYYSYHGVYQNISKEHFSNSKTQLKI